MYYQKKQNGVSPDLVTVVSDTVLISVIVWLSPKGACISANAMVSADSDCGG